MLKRMMASILVLALVAGCASTRLLKASVSPEDKADNLAQIFVAYQSAVVALVQTPGVSLREKRIIATANGIAAIGAKALLEASGAYRKAKDAAKNAQTNGDTKDMVILGAADAALIVLESALKSYEKPILSFKSVMVRNGAQPVTVAPVQ